MTRVRIVGIVVAAASIGMAGCAIGPVDDRERMTDLPLAATHSDITFMLTTGSRQHAACAETSTCASRGDAVASTLTPFAAQMQRVADELQHGARALYPDLALRIPGFADSGFDVYVVAGDEPGSVSSASGKIALNAGLGVVLPYDDWLAFVIAREMGHVIARHHEDNSTVSIATSMVMNVLLPWSGLLKSVASKIGSELAIGGKREQQLREADAIALRLLQSAGYRLHDVALSLAITPAGPDGGSWSQDFRKSSDRLVAEARGSKLALATGTAAVTR